MIMNDDDDDADDDDYDDYDYGYGCLNVVFYEHANCWI